MTLSWRLPKMTGEIHAAMIGLKGLSNMSKIVLNDVKVYLYLAKNHRTRSY